MNFDIMFFVMVINEDLLNKLRVLSKHDRLNLLKILSVESCDITKKKHTITELAGLGKDIWEDEDIQEYIDKERSNWD